MGQALYRKYRPKSFSEAVGQEVTTKTLAKAVKSGRISHAYLFAGPRGVGKTSIARILAHEVNNLPYNDNLSHLDIIEIDAASNRRIDEIRDLREKVHIMPTSAKYKVYIIDEVHMLTKEAFNALLKTLEEPPAHCIFILATTEPHKLPETIISRTQRFNFKPISNDSARVQLQMIAKAEKIHLSEEALDLLAEYGDGSLRDNIGLLDQLSTAERRVSEEDVRSALGIPPAQAVTELTGYITQGDTRAALETLEKLADQSANPASVAKAISHRLRSMIISGEISGEWVNALLKNLLDVPASTSPHEALELGVLEAASRNQSSDQVNRMQQALAKKNDKPVEPARNNVSPKAVAIKPISKIADFNLSQWPEVLVKVKQTAPSLYTALRLAIPAHNDGVLELTFPFSLHQKKVQEARHLQIIGRAIEGVSGSKIEIRCLVERGLPVESNSGKSKTFDDTELQTISNIFGSAEVVES
jgi:DNA polymerase-3 subunit gamma/tau